MAEVRDAIRAVSDYDHHSLREMTIKRYGFSIPTVESVKLIVSYSPLVEVGAGSGYWAKLLKNAGADIVATDIGKQSDYSKLWMGAQVEQMSADDAVLKWPERNVFVSWPSYDLPWAGEMAAKIRPGKVLVYIGESRGGCTADDGFFKLLEEGFDEVDSMGLPTWFGIHDSLSIYRRK
jgi:hypothetical protein